MHIFCHTEVRTFDQVITLWLIRSIMNDLYRNVHGAHAAAGLQAKFEGCLIDIARVTPVRPDVGALVEV